MLSLARMANVNISGLNPFVPPLSGLSRKRKQLSKDRQFYSCHRICNVHMGNLDYCGTRDKLDMSEIALISTHEISVLVCAISVPHVCYLIQESTGVAWLGKLGRGGGTQCRSLPSPVVSSSLPSSLGSPAFDCWTMPKRVPLFPRSARDPANLLRVTHAASKEGEGG